MFYFPECSIYSDYDITASVDLDDVIQAKNTNNSNPGQLNRHQTDIKQTSCLFLVKRSLSGTWNKPNNSEQDQLIQPQSPKRTISTQTLEGKVTQNRQPHLV